MKQKLVCSILAALALAFTGASVAQTAGVPTSPQVQVLRQLAAHARKLALNLEGSNDDASTVSQVQRFRAQAEQLDAQADAIEQSIERAKNGAAISPRVKEQQLEALGRAHSEAVMQAMREAQARLQAVRTAEERAAIVSEVQQANRERQQAYEEQLRKILAQ